MKSTFEIQIDKNGTPIFGEDFHSYCKTLEDRKHFVTISDSNPESRWTLLMCRSIHGDMNMLSKATDHNVSAEDWKATCKGMRLDLFETISSIRNPITGERKSRLRSLTDPELSRRDILDWMKTYRENMEQVWEYGTPELNIPPLKEIYRVPKLYWYTKNDMLLKQLAEKEKLHEMAKEAIHAT